MQEVVTTTKPLDGVVVCVRVYIGEQQLLEMWTCDWDIRRVFGKLLGDFLRAEKDIRSCRWTIHL